MVCLASSWSRRALFSPNRRRPPGLVVSASVETRLRAAARAVGASRRTASAVSQSGSSKHSLSSGNPISTSRNSLLADLCLLFHQAAPKTSRLLGLGSQQRVFDARFLAHTQCRQCAGIGRVRLAPLQPALGKVFSLQRIDNCNRVATAVEVTGQRPVIVPAGLQHHPLDRTLAFQPTVQLVESSPVGGEPKHISFGFPFSRLCRPQPRACTHLHQCRPQRSWRPPYFWSTPRVLAYL